MVWLVSEATGALQRRAIQAFFGRFLSKSLILAMKMDPDAKKSVTKVVGTCLNTILTKFGTSNLTYVVTVRL